VLTTILIIENIISGVIKIRSNHELLQETSTKPEVILGEYKPMGNFYGVRLVKEFFMDFSLDSTTT
jgi:hypothetical protein